MSPDKRTSKAGQQKSSKPAKMEDLKPAKVPDKDAGKVKGGLNPQPLPPKIIPRG